MGADFFRWQRGVVWVMDLAAGERPVRREPRLGVQFAEVGPEEAGALARAVGAPDVAVVRQRLVGQRRCFAGRVGAEIATYCWLSQGRECVGEMERMIGIPAGAGYVWDCATRPAYRRQGLYTALLGFMGERLAAEGLRRIWIGANVENVPSLQAFRRVGYRPVLTMSYLRLPLVSFLFCAADEQASAELVEAGRRMFTRPDERWVGPVNVGRAQRDGCWEIRD